MVAWLFISFFISSTNALALNEQYCDAISGAWHGKWKNTLCRWNADVSIYVSGKNVRFHVVLANADAPAFCKKNADVLLFGTCSPVGELEIATLDDSVYRGYFSDNKIELHGAENRFYHALLFKRLG